MAKDVNAPKVGEEAPDFTLKSHLDKEVKLSDFRGKKNVVLAFTNQSDFQYDLLIANVGGIESKVVTMVPLTTYRFDAAASGWVLNGPSSIQIFTQASGTVAMSGYEVRKHSHKKIRINPVKAAAYL